MGIVQTNHRLAVPVWRKELWGSPGLSFGKWERHCSVLGSWRNIQLTRHRLTVIGTATDSDL